MSEDQNKKVNEIVISLYFDMCLTRTRTYTPYENNFQGKYV